MELDKDILKKWNKVYNKYNCIFVPKEINMLFSKSRKSKDGLPIGVHKTVNKTNPYRATMSKSECGTYNIGFYNTPELAFNAYKMEKEKYIKEVSEKYKDVIPQNLYKIMNEYIVEILD